MEKNEFLLPADDIKGILEFPCGILRLRNGNTLITDAGSETGRGSELIEVNPQGTVIRQIDLGFRFLHSVTESSAGTLLLADTTNNRVLEITHTGEVLFSSDKLKFLSDGTRLHYPNYICSSENSEYMVTDRNNNRFVIFDREGKISRVSSGKYKHPHNCEPLNRGHILIADSDAGSIDEIDETGNLVWQYDKELSWPRDANRLPNGNTLISDSKNNRVIEVTPEKQIVWEYSAAYFANFYEAHRLGNGNTLISDQQHKQVIEVNKSKQIVWHFRNFIRETPIQERLFNGSFKKRTSDNIPLGWHLAVRFSEGGGGFIWGSDDRGKDVPGLVFDRSGALTLQQSVAIIPGTRYTLGGSLKTVNLDGFSCFQVAFLDSENGLLCEAALSPKGMSFSGDTDWTEDSFEVIAPETAVAADIRIFITGTGKCYFKQLRFFA